MSHIIVGLIITYVITTTWETIVHWKILHAKKSTRLIWKKLGGPFNLMRKAYFSHAIIHHKKTFCDNHFIQFKTPFIKFLFDSKLDTPFRRRIKNNRYGLTVSAYTEIIVFTGIPFIFAVIVFGFLAPYYFVFGLALSFIPVLLSRYIHPLLHEKDVDTIFAGKMSVLKPLHSLVKRYMRFIQHYHYLHHQHEQCNFNLMLGGDYLLGVWKHEKQTDKFNKGIYSDNNRT